ncbi:hypothetical protein QC820_16220 [Halomonas mongoliensis]|uniref:MORN repeat variant n=1 Tax=Halomonas mongoliensis TaxID=321265 RepID=A0ABU1GQL7_9GAMM|nr:hypothetical protein [Halomonas mongoliensis]MDR5894337.1 hypothetical protein [Halomonas mongoliensis]
MRVGVFSWLGFLLCLLFLPLTANGEQEPNKEGVHLPVWLDHVHCPVSEADARYYLDHFEEIDGGYRIFVYYADTRTLRFSANVRDLELCGTEEYFGEYLHYHSRLENVLSSSQLYNSEGKRDGLNRFYDTEGRIQRQYPYENGKLQGVAQHFFPSGELAEKTIYKNGRRHGESKEWDEKGNLARHVSYYEGERHGQDTRYFTSDEYLGEVVSTGKYEHGRAIGPQYIYYRPGQLRQKSIYNEQGRFIQEERYNEEGLLIFKHAPADTPYGSGYKTRTYNNSGVLTGMHQASHERNWELIKHYSSKGDVIKRLERIDGRRQNSFVQPGLGGRTEYGSYFDGKPHGDFYVLNNDGERVKEGRYDKGVKVGRWVEIRENFLDRQRVVTNFNDEGERHGSKEIFLEDGALLQREHYRNGILHGEFVRYDGEVKISHGNYEDGEREGEWLVSPSLSRNRVQRGTLNNGLMVGRWETMNAHGHLIDINQLNEDGRINGRQLHFKDDGSLKMLREFVDGREHGIRVYYEGGRPSHAERYEDGHYAEDLGKVENWPERESTRHLEHGL